MIAFSTSGPAKAAQAGRAVTPDPAGGPRRASGGNQAWLRRLASGGGAKSQAANGSDLLIGGQNDPLEHEADRVADQVMRTPDPRSDPPADALASPVGDLRLGRKCSACDKEEPKIQAKAGPQGLARKCSACEDEDKTVRPKAAGAAPAGAGQAAPPAVRGVLDTPGRPLDAPLRDFFEPRFGSDFSAVRLHTDAEAGASARQVGALAYAAGHHVVVDPDHYRPDDDAGRRLLAHELAHTLQQGAGQPLAKLRRAGDGADVPAPEAAPTPAPDEAGGAETMEEGDAGEKGKKKP